MYNTRSLPLVTCLAAACLVSTTARTEPPANASTAVSPTEFHGVHAKDNSAHSAAGSLPGRAEAPPTDVPPENAARPFTLGAYVEAFYQWNFNDPTNDITNFRGFDNRHNSFTLSNAALDAQWDDERLIGRVTLQVGHTPSTYYLAEPHSDGASGANTSNAELWKYLQQAYTGYRFGPASELSVTGGLFLSPIGPEGMAVRDNWNWSRSNLFFGLPFYHTGARATYAVSERWAVTLAGYNGWNSVVDNNAGKSLSTQLTYTTPEVAVSALYFGGVERPRGAPEGRPWRHLFDAHATWHAADWLSVLAHVNGGFEPNVFGVSRWGAAALYGRVKVAELVFFAVRGDVFAEHRAQNREGQASSLFWPAPWVASSTATVDLRPHERISLRFEYRHDHAGGNLYFGAGAVRQAATNDYVPNRSSQDTLTAGATTWF